MSQSTSALALLLAVLLFGAQSADKGVFTTLLNVGPSWLCSLFMGFFARWALHESTVGRYGKVSSNPGTRCELSLSDVDDSVCRFVTGWWTAVLVVRVTKLFCVHSDTTGQ